MSYLQDQYSKNDYNLYSYLNQKIIQSVMNKIYLEAWKNGPNFPNIKQNIINISSDKKYGFFPKALQYYYNTNTNKGLSVSFFTSNNNLLKTLNSDSPAEFLQTCIPMLDRNYRMILVDKYPDPSLMITNFSYDKKYLSGTSLDGFYPSATDLHMVAPKIYLELCSTSINDFFAKIFTQLENGKTRTVGKTIDEINNFCIQKGSVNKVNQACAYDKTNIRCACEDCFIGHSAENRQIATSMKNAGVVPSDPWCLYPKCASGKAFKNRLMKGRSACANISLSGIFLNPSEYSNIEISDTQVTTSANNGINIYSGWCSDCTEDEKCISQDNKMVCVPKDGSKLNNTTTKLNISAKNQVNNSNDSSSKIQWPLPLIIIFSCITFILFVLFAKYKNNQTKLQYINVGLFVSIFMVLFSLTFYILSTKSEKYSPFITPSCNNVCYRDLDCANSQFGTSCIGNQCQCPIGKFLDTKNCVDFYGKTQFYRILTTIPYLPESIFAGVYYYSTQINGTIYVFSSRCGFKYDGEQWVELSRYPKLYGENIGFNPDTPRLPFQNNGTVIPNFDRNYILNTHMCKVSGSKIYFLIGPNNTVLNHVIHQSLPNPYFYMVYDTVTDNWTGLNPTIPSSASNENIQRYKDTFLPKPTINVIKNNIMYIFQNRISGAGQFETRVYTLDLNTNVLNNSTEKPITNYTFGDFSYGFVHKDIIYIGGIYETAKSNIPGYNIYSFNPSTNKFTFEVILVNDAAYFPYPTLALGFRGAVLPFYRESDGTFIIMYNSRVASVNMSTLKANSTGKCLHPDGVSIFNVNASADTQKPIIWQPFSAGNCTFQINGYVFIITGSGEIFRGYYDTSVKNTINIVLNPCYGVSNYSRPLEKQIIQT